MGVQLNDTEVVCCFCGETLLLNHAAIIIIQPNIESEEQQQLFCHKNHLIEKLDKSVPLHPDFFEDQYGNN
jgi:hypothetical protein